MPPVCHDLAVPDAFSEFTEAGYRRIAERAAARFAFEPFGTTSGGPHALWRHDVDLSMHRAVRLAQIEADLGVRSTWFLMLGSSFYNLFERDVLDRARELVALGHWIGLHFDATSWLSAGRNQMLDEITKERAILAQALETPVDAISFHNPPSVPVPGLEDEQLAGMTSAVSPVIVERYTYVSDSNGYWRYRSLVDVVDDPAIERLHALTHPEWWPERPMPPRERVALCVEGRAAAVLAVYDDALAAVGRKNVRTDSDL
jgi:hypothetical protein